MEEHVFLLVAVVEHGHAERRWHASNLIRSSGGRGRTRSGCTRAGDSWQVSFLTQGRLMGPRQTVYEAIHRQAKFAAWDVMAKVISVSHDEEIGVEVAVQAAQWMRRAESSSPHTSA